MKSLFKALLSGTVRVAAWPLSEGGKLRALNIIRQGMGIGGFDEIIRDIPTGRGVVRFYCLGDAPVWRAESLLTKEPETIDWIDTMDAGDVLYDIGANVGVYTLYAAVNRRNRVLAFEPLASNYYLLNRNIEWNGLSDVATAYCLALNDRDMTGSFHVQDTSFGSALSSFADPIDHNGNIFTAKFEQGMFGLTLDTFIERFDPLFPTHLKIDVDGIEDRIVVGAQKTLADPRLKSILIELDSSRPDYTSPIITQIEKHGFKLEGRRHSQMVEDSIFSHLYNYVFRR